MYIRVDQQNKQKIYDDNKSTQIHQPLYSSPYITAKGDRTPIVKTIINMFIGFFIFLRKNPVLIIPTIFALLLLGGLGYMFTLYKDSQKQLKSYTGDNTAASVTGTPDEVKRIVSSVGHHLVLPQNEEPKLVTLSNVAMLKKNQQFFSSAKDGDKMLIYSAKVILYDPIADKVVDIAQIRPPTPTGGQIQGNSGVVPAGENTQVQGVAAKKLSLGILNGSGSKDVLEKVRPVIEKTGNLEITRSSTANKLYDKSMLISLKNIDNVKHSELSNALSASKSTLYPKSEATPSPDLDLILIIGKDKLQ